MTHRKKTSDHLEETELNRLLKFFRNQELHTYYMLARLGVSTALRFSDLSKITWAEIIGKKELVLQEQKTKKVRIIPIPEELSATTEEIFVKLKIKDPNQRIINLHIRTINKQLKIYAAKAGIKNKRVSTHTWRKTFGREVWRRNSESEGSLIKLSLLFNHSSVAITRIYLNITKEEVDDLYDLQDMFVH